MSRPFAQMRDMTLTGLKRRVAGLRRRSFLIALGAFIAASAVALAVTLPLTLPVAQAVGFDDVPGSHPYHVQIETLAQLGILDGYEDGDFVPDAPITCEEYIDLVAAAMHAPAADIDDHGVDPGTELDLAQMVAIGMSAAGRELPDPPDYFVSTWGETDPAYASAVRLAEYNRMLRGLVSTERDLKALYSTQPASRGHAVAFIFNLMGTDQDGMCGRFVGDASDLVAYFRANSGGDDGRFSVSLGTLARYYIIYADRFGIRADMAWAQMIHETGYGQYGGDVLPEQNNMAGIGATGGVPGNSWSTAELGVIAHYVHLAWYVYPLHMSDEYCVLVTQPVDGPITVPGDPRHFVQEDASPHRGGVATVLDLGGKWAISTDYGTALETISVGINAMCDAGKKGIQHR